MKTYEEKTKECRSWTDSEIKGFFGFGENEYGWLSNFHYCDVVFDGEVYPSSENAYMAAKTLDLDIRKKFQSLKPVDAKKFGHFIVLRPNWEEIKLDVMFLVIFDKFSRNPDIRQKLLDTGEKYLEETNWWKDLCWGVDFKTGEGENNLGKILMRVRNILR